MKNIFAMGIAVLGTILLVSCGSGESTQTKRTVTGSDVFALPGLEDLDLSESERQELSQLDLDEQTADDAALSLRYSRRSYVVEVDTYIAQIQRVYGPYEWTWRNVTRKYYWVRSTNATIDLPRGRLFTLFCVEGCSSVTEVEDESIFAAGNYIELTGGKMYWSYLHYYPGKIALATPETGDINADFKITEADAELIRAYAAGEQNLTEEQLERSDCNGDNKVSELDADVIEAKANGTISNELPLVFGDVTGNGDLSGYDSVQIARHALGLELLEKWQQAVADVDLDGAITEKDAKHVAEATVGLITLPVIEEVVEQPSTIIGDIDGDFEITKADADLIRNYASDDTSLDEAQLERADCNGDGKVTALDADVIDAKADGTLTNELPLLFGDLTGNGDHSGLDAQRVAAHVAGVIQLEKWQIAVADANQDGQLTKADSILIASKVVGLIKSLPMTLGDVTGNGDLSGMDSVEIARHALGKTVLADWQQALADVDLDGEITEKDAKYVSQSVVGLITLPVR